MTRRDKALTCTCIATGWIVGLMLSQGPIRWVYAVPAIAIALISNGLAWWWLHE